MNYTPTTEEHIKRLRLNILIHSCLYYIFNRTLISDHQYDRMALDLARLQREYPDISAELPYAEAFRDWDGETTSGFSLPLEDPWVMAKAEYLLIMSKKQ